MITYALKLQLMHQLRLILITTTAAYFMQNTFKVFFLFLLPQFAAITFKPFEHEWNSFFLDIPLFKYCFSSLKTLTITKVLLSSFEEVVTSYAIISVARFFLGLYKNFSSEKIPYPVQIFYYILCSGSAVTIIFNVFKMVFLGQLETVCSLSGQFFNYTFKVYIFGGFCLAIYFYFLDKSNKPKEDGTNKDFLNVEFDTKVVENDFASLSTINPDSNVEQQETTNRSPLDQFDKQSFEDHQIIHLGVLCNLEKNCCKKGLDLGPEQTALHLKIIYTHMEIVRRQSDLRIKIELEKFELMKKKLNIFNRNDHF